MDTGYMPRNDRNVMKSILGVVLGIIVLIGISGILGWLMNQLMSTDFGTFLMNIKSRIIVEGITGIVYLIPLWIGAATSSFVAKLFCSRTTAIVFLTLSGVYYVSKAVLYYLNYSFSFSHVVDLVDVIIYPVCLCIALYIQYEGVKDNIQDATLEHILSGEYKQQYKNRMVISVILTIVAVISIVFLLTTANDSKATNSADTSETTFEQITFNIPEGFEKGDKEATKQLVDTLEGANEGIVNKAVSYVDEDSFFYVATMGKGIGEEALKEIVSSARNNSKKTETGSVVEKPKYTSHNNIRIGSFKSYKDDSDDGYISHTSYFIHDGEVYIVDSYMLSDEEHKELINSIDFR